MQPQPHAQQDLWERSHSPVWLDSELLKASTKTQVALELCLPHCSAASCESERVQDVTTIFSLPAGLLAVCIHVGCVSADHSSFSRLPASSALVCIPLGVQQAQIAMSNNSSGVTHAMYADNVLHSAFLLAFLH